MDPHLTRAPVKRIGPLAVAESRFLNSLPPDLLARIATDLTEVELRRDTILARAGHPVEFVYFPAGCIVSTVVTLETGNTIEATTIGSDGLVDVAVFLGKQNADANSMVQVPGRAFRMPVDAYKVHLEDRRLHDRIGQFVSRMFATIAQSTACVAFHPAHERLARWLLMVRDGVEHDEFPLTHEFMAIMLGVHRPTVTIAIRLLESAGLIEHRRGSIRIIDGDALQDAACECYRLQRRYAEES